MTHPRSQAFEAWLSQPAVFTFRELDPFMSSVTQTLKIWKEEAHENKGSCSDVSKGFLTRGFLLETLEKEMMGVTQDVQTSALSEKA